MEKEKETHKTGILWMQLNGFGPGLAGRMAKWVTTRAPPS